MREEVRELNGHLAMEASFYSDGSAEREDSLLEGSDGSEEPTARS